MLMAVFNFFFQKCIKKCSISSKSARAVSLILCRKAHASHDATSPSCSTGGRSQANSPSPVRGRRLSYAGPTTGPALPTPPALTARCIPLVVPPSPPPPRTLARRDFFLVRRQDDADARRLITPASRLPGSWLQALPEPRLAVHDASALILVDGGPETWLLSTILEMHVDRMVLLFGIALRDNVDPFDGTDARRLENTTDVLRIKVVVDEGNEDRVV